MSLSEIRRVVSTREATTRTESFASLVRSFMMARGDCLLAARIADGQGKTQAAEVLKAAVTAGSLSTYSAIAPFNDLFAAFLESLRNVSCFDAMKPDMRIVPLQSRVLLVSGGAAASTVDEGASTPVSQLSLSAGTMPLQKAVAIVAVTEELLTQAGGVGETLLMSELRSAVAVQTDAKFITALVAGLTPIPASGTTVAATMIDLRAAMAAISGTSQSRYWLITTPAIGKNLALDYEAGSFVFPDLTPTGGSLQGISVFISDGVPSGEIILADARQIIAADDGGELDYSSEALLELSSTPDSPATSSTVLISLWQNNLRALKFSRSFAIDRPRAGSVAVISGAAYGQ